MKKIPMRSCVITHEKCEKKNLFRVVRTPEKTVILDETGKANGRGAYLKKDESVISKARTTKALDKILEIEVPDDIYSLMLEKIN